MASVAAQARTRSRDSSAPIAGLFLILTAFATVAAVVARIAANTDLPTLAESLAAISENRILYGAGGLGRFVSGVTLTAAGWLLLRTWLVRERHDSPIAPAVLAVSGLATAVSGACAVVLSFSASDHADPSSISAATEAVATARWITGAMGFAVSGLALIAFAIQQWKAGTPLRFIAPVSGIMGLVMQFIWWDAATTAHRVTGIAFLVWLMGVGVMYLHGMVERHFAARSASSLGSPR